MIINTAAIIRTLIWKGLIDLLELSERVKTVLWGMLLPLVLLIAWEGLTAWNLVPPQLLSPPEKVFRRLLLLWRNGSLFKHIFASLYIVGVGFSLGSALGLILGAGMGMFKTFDLFAHPMFNAIRQIPLFGWLPFLILLCGIGDRFKIIFVAANAFYTMGVNAYEGIRNVSVKHLELADIFEYSHARRFFHVVVPEALPSIFIGIRNGLGLSWMSVIGAEMVAASKGLGFLINESRTMLRYDAVYASIIIIGIMGLILNYIVEILEKRVLHWRKTFVNATEEGN
jgi:sulfonate transport system permease protein